MKYKSFLFGIVIIMALVGLSCKSTPKKVDEIIPEVEIPSDSEAKKVIIATDLIIFGMRNNTHCPITGYRQKQYWNLTK